EERVQVDPVQDALASTCPVVMSVMTNVVMPLGLPWLMVVVSSPSLTATWNCHVLPGLLPVNENPLGAATIVPFGPMMSSKCRSVSDDATVVEPVSVVVWPPTSVIVTLTPVVPASA